MDYIKFYNDRVVVNIWNENYEKWEEVKLSFIEKPISRYLRYLVMFDENLTVENFLRHLKTDMKNLNTIFKSSMGGFPLDPFFDELDKDSTDELNDEIDCVEFYWATEIYENDFSEYCSYHGPGKPDDKGDVINWSFGFSPLQNWKHHIIKLNHEYVIDKYNFDGPKWDSVYKGREILFKGEKEFTLYDILDGFFFELSFYGSPENRDEKSKDLERVHDAYENGELELVEFDYKLEMMEQELKSFISEEKFEEADELKKLIEKYKEKLDE